MKLIAEYLFEAVKFERMASETNDPELKAAFRKQAADYRRLAAKQAKEVGSPPPDTSPEVKS
jgi:hypothetical protein